MMKAKKAKKAKLTELDRIAALIRGALKRETTNIIEIGNFLIESREHLEHGDWQDWLGKNFDLSYRTARNYIGAAEYVENVESKSATVAPFDFENLSPTVLYWLAAGCNYNEQEEAAIWAAAREGRVDHMRAKAICEALAQAVEAAEQKDGDKDGGADGAKEDADISAILDGPPPAVRPTPPNPPPTDFALQNFNEAISTLNRLKTKLPAQFAKTSHSADDLESVEIFIHAVSASLKCPT